MTEILLDKLYSLCLIQSKQSLEATRVREARVES